VNTSSFKPSAELTFATVQAVRKRLLKYLHEDQSEIVRLDLSEVVHCDSAGLALLIEAKRLCLHYKKTFEIDGVPKAIYALAEFCGVDAMLMMRI
jgi:phospholipid transport system transporter-binding protein